MNTTSARHIYRLGVAVVLLLTLLLTGCATQEDTARAQGTGIGAGIGAAVGAGLGYALGGAQGALIGAGVGAGLGAAGGYMYADQVAKRHEMLKGKEQDLNTRIAFAEAVNSDTRAYNQRLQKEVTDLEPKIASLETRMKAQRVTKEELQDLQSFRAKQSSASPRLDAQIAALEANLEETKAHTAALASQSARI